MSQLYICTRCGVAKPLTEYYKDGVYKGATRYRNACKECYKDDRRDAEIRNAKKKRRESEVQ